jgi:hypothetical protein
LNASFFQGFEFIRNLLTLLLQHGLDPNVRFSQRHNHILLSLMDMVRNARVPSDLNYVYDLTLTLIQYGANPNVSIDNHADREDGGGPGPIGYHRNGHGHQDRGAAMGAAMANTASIRSNQVPNITT